MAKITEETNQIQLEEANCSEDSGANAETDLGTFRGTCRAWRQYCREEKPFRTYMRYLVQPLEFTDETPETARALMTRRQNLSRIVILGLLGLLLALAALKICMVVQGA